MKKLKLKQEGQRDISSHRGTMGRSGWPESFRKYPIHRQYIASAITLVRNERCRLGARV